MTHKKPLTEEYSCFLASRYHDPIKQYFGNKGYTLGDTDLTGRVLNHWTNYELLPDHRLESGKGWRNFSIVDLIWIRVLIELREIGLGLEKLKNSYKSIFEANIPANKISLFEFAIFSTLFNGESIHLLVSVDDGRINIINKKDFRNYISSNNTIDNFIHINLKQCMEKVKPDADYFSNLPISNFKQEECK